LGGAGGHEPSGGTGDLGGASVYGGGDPGLSDGAGNGTGADAGAVELGIGARGAGGMDSDGAPGIGVKGAGGMDSAGAGGIPKGAGAVIRGVGAAGGAGGGGTIVFSGAACQVVV
jgi:hypothetical protein